MAQKPRILQICHDYKGPFPTVARQYAGCFSDCDVTTLFLHGRVSTSLARGIHGDVEFLTLPPGELRGLKLSVTRQIRDMIAGSPPDLIIGHRYKPFYIAQLLNYQLQTGAVVGVMHEYGFLDRWSRSLFSRFWKDNVHLIGVSEPLLEATLKSHPHLNGRLHLIHHSIDAPTLLDPVSARHELGIPPGRFCFGIIGRLVRMKNHALLLEAMAKLDDDSILAIVGDGKLEESLMRQVKRLGLSDRVVFCGAHDDARRMMRAFDAFVFSSTEADPFGIVLLEAMAASVPIISSDAAGPLSVVGDTALTFAAGNAGDLCARMAAMRAMSRDEASRQAARALARLGSHFSVSAMIQNIRSIPIVEQHAPPGATGD